MAEILKQFLYKHIYISSIDLLWSVMAWLLKQILNKQYFTI